MQENIISDLKKNYGITFEQIVPVTGGWLNRKWKITTGKRNLLVKQFSSRRFSRKKLEAVEDALQRQAILAQNGVPCPAVWLCGGCAIRLLYGDTAYMAMDFCPGKTEGPDTITVPQMRSLGSACGRIHHAFSTLFKQTGKEALLDGQQLLDSLWANHRTHLEQCTSTSPSEYQTAVLAQPAILSTLSPAFFDQLPKGIAHEDFTSDNILFGPDSVTAVIDFDRNQYSFLWHDIGRAILSFALRNQRLDMEKIRVFLEGYSQHLPLTMQDLADALRISWCLETPWWIQPEYFTGDRGKATRFRDEILWLTAHWFEIDSIFGNN